MRTFFDDHNIESLENIDCHSATKRPLTIKFVQILEPFRVETKEGWMEGKAHDIIIMGVARELYVCDLNIFKRTYNYNTFLIDPPN